jgi:hypothetical protein
MNLKTIYGVRGVKIESSDGSITLNANETEELYDKLTEVYGHRLYTPDPLPLHLRVWQPPPGASADPTLADNNARLRPTP